MSEIKTASWGKPILCREYDDVNGGYFNYDEVPCTNCGYTVPDYKKTAFCPGCGAKMIKEETK